MRNTTCAKISILTASALTVGACLSAGMAFADPDPQTPPNAGAQSGAGATALTMVMEGTDREYGGTDAEAPYANPDGPDADEWGDNLAFSAPSAINFVAKADGTLLAPRSGIDIVNRSVVPVRVSSLKIDENSADGWHIVSSSSAAANTQNAVWGTIGVPNDLLNWADYTAAKSDVVKGYEWNMTSSGNAGDSLSLAASGSFANLDRDLSVAKTFATIHWYLRIGTAASPVTISNGTAVNGSFSVGASSTPAETDLFFPGTTAYVVTTPDPGYKLSSVTVVETGSSNTIPVSINGNTASFTVPAAGAMVTPVFVKDDYNLTNSPAPTANGSFIMSKNINATTPDATAQYGDDVYIIADPDVGYVLADATVTGSESGNDVATVLLGDDKARFTMPAEPVSAEVAFEKADFALSSNAATVEHGSFALKSDPSRADAISTAQMGDTVYVVAAPDAGYVLGSVTVTGTTTNQAVVPAIDGNTASFTMIADDVGITVSFAKADLSLASAVNPQEAHGSIAFKTAPDAQATISTAQVDDTVYIVAAPDTGYRLASISVTGAGSSNPVDVTVDGNTASFTMPAEAVSASAVFEAIGYSLTKSPADNGSFALSSSPSGTPEIATATYGQAVYIVASPAQNYEISSVSVNGSAIEPSGGAYSFPMPAGDAGVAVTFRGVASTLAKANADNGSFVVGRTADAASDATDVRYGDVLYVIPTPDANYEVSSVTVNGTPIAAEQGAYRFTAPANSTTVAVSFRGIAATVAKSPTSNGSFVVGRTANAAADATDTRYNDILYIVPTPDANYEVESVTVNGSPISASGGSYSFDLPASGSTIAVSFRGVSATVTKSTTSNGSFIVGSSSSATSDAANTRYNDTLYVIPSPNTGYQVSSVTVNGAPIAASSGTYSFSLPASDATVAVSFTPIIYSISKDASQNGSFIVDDAATPVADITQAPYASTVYVSVAPAPGYQVDQVNVTGLGSGQVTSIALSNGKGSFTMPAEAVNVTATFAATTYSIAYDLNKGSGSTDPEYPNPVTSYRVDTPTFSLPNPTRAGYAFAGWTGSNGSAPQIGVEIAQGSTEDKAYTANWTANTYTVHYNANGGAGSMPDSTFTFDGAGELSSNGFVAPDGYAFGGWANSVANATAGTVWRAAGEAHGNMAPSGTVDVYAIWYRDITFYSGESNTESTIVTQHWNGTSGENITTPPSATDVSGWDTIGWRTSSGAGAQDVNLNASIMPNTTSYYAAYSRPAHFYSGLSTSTANTTATQYRCGQSYTLTTPDAGTCVDIANWTELGWRDDTSADVALSGFGDTWTTSSSAFYAVYSRSGTISYAPNGGSGTTSSTSGGTQRYSSYGDITSVSVTLDDNGFIAPSGYAFDGWDLGSAGSSYTWTPAVGSAASTTATAQWTGVSYTVRFNANGGSGSMSNQTGFAYGTSKTLNANGFTAPSTYSFAGWATTLARAQAGTVDYSNQGSMTYGTTTSGDTVDLYAVWTRIISFKSGYNSATTKTAAQPYGGNVTVPSGNASYPYSGVGWSLAGWRTDTSRSAATYTASSFAPSAQILYAVYTRTGTMSYAGNGNTGGSTSSSTSSTQYYNSGATATSSISVTLRANGFTKSGYDFNDWDLGSANASYSWTPAYNVSANKTATAQWRLSAPALPTVSTFSSTSIEHLHDIGNYLVGEGKTDTAYRNQAKALVGQTISVALNSGRGTMTARLVSVDNTRGLTFEAVDVLTTSAMNGSNTNAGGWAASALRTSMNSGDIYTTYFSSSALAGKVRQVTNTSYSYGGGSNTSSDYYWIPSANNIYGAGWQAGYVVLSGTTYSDGTSDTQFDYYVGKTAANNATDDDLVKKYNSSDCRWWLRSAYPANDAPRDFMVVRNDGRLTDFAPYNIYGVVPCFCL